ncbi:MAG: hypothetical protein CL678_19070 [Bdellovibrionaceae bacterium]|nr:hypothetical protein [Pseudobdellovibrionaceae bacterium]|tara:strand:- start:129 stop:1109 length:981 start_codon:yes stop_codon:yes gene_type:complete
MKVESNMGTHYFVTYSCQNYIHRILALAESLENQDTECHLLIYTEDKKVSDIIAGYSFKKVSAVHFPEMYSEKYEEIINNRSRVGYIFTCKSFFLEDAMERFDGDWFIWIDGDTSFFAEPDSVLNLRSESILLTPHRFTSSFEIFKSQVGIYNAGVAGFKKNEIGKKCLSDWKLKCIDWCDAYVDDENQNFADQKYFDELSRKYEDHIFIPHAGFNAGPYSTLERNVKKEQNTIYIEDSPLILYHYQGLKILSPRWVDYYAARNYVPKNHRKFIYKPYFDRVQKYTLELLPKYAFLKNTFPKIHFNDLKIQLKRKLEHTSNLGFHL